MKQDHNCFIQLQHRLFFITGFKKPLVAASGNISEAAIVFDDTVNESSWHFMLK
jgi:hypothetical protein